MMMSYGFVLGVLVVVVVAALNLVAGLAKRDGDTTLAMYFVAAAIGVCVVGAFLIYY